ncbi:C-C chemokine receptor type 5-like protein [Labeo rohita]|uniref:C-C chemokine receptor type 5-like protein n=1 Tax=Labeo rohita TaxID=84645 RepID=A0A498MU06_LABRO|nr:C-C chemokine receptor type 5-like protein [Labeo rohita]RXN22874.1 C-C chemokine receptor type 5-like protein [Labeo rohita]
MAIQQLAASFKFGAPRPLKTFQKMLGLMEQGVPLEMVCRKKVVLADASNSEQNPNCKRLVYALLDSQSDTTFVDQGNTSSGFLIMNSTVVLLRTTALPPLTLDSNLELTSMETTTFDYGETDDICLTEDSHLYTDLKAAIFCIVFALGLIGNITILWVLLKIMHVKNMTNLCLLNLALSDLLMVLSLPFWGLYVQGHYIKANEMCKAMAGIYQVGFYSRILFVTLMSVDHYLVIVHAVEVLGAKMLHYGIMVSFVIWIVSICAALPEAIFAAMVTEDNITSCQRVYPDGSAQKWKLFRNFGENVVGLFISLPIIAYCYIRVLMVVKKTKNSKKERAIKLILGIIIMFVVFWVPYNVVVFLKTLQEFGILTDCEAYRHVNMAMDLTETIALTHCCVNPIIYAFVGEKFRKCLAIRTLGFLTMNSTAVLLRTTAQSPWTGTVSNTIPYLNLTSSSMDGPVPGASSSDAPYSEYSGYYDGNEVDLTSAPCHYGTHGANILSVLYSLFFIVGFLGNILVIWVVLMGVRLRSMTDICLLNLAIADLLLVSSLPFLAHHAKEQWIFGDGMCTIVLGVYHIGFYSGIFFIVLMSVDRYLAVVHAVFALRVRTRTYGILASVIIWITAVSASFPELIHLKTTEDNGTKVCTSYQTSNRDSYQNSKIIGIFKMNIIGLFLPMLVIGFCYSMILMRLLNARSSRRQAMRLVIAVMVVFFCCWAPYNIAAFVKVLELKNHITQSCEGSKAINLSLQITEALAYSHSSLNPFLYVFVGEKFRRQLFRLLYRTPFSRLQFMKSYIIRAPGSVYSQTTSLDERSATAV